MVVPLLNAIVVTPPSMPSSALEFPFTGRSQTPESEPRVAIASNFFEVVGSAISSCPRRRCQFRRSLRRPTLRRKFLHGLFDLCGLQEAIIVRLPSDSLRRIIDRTGRAEILLERGSENHSRCYPKIGKIPSQQRGHIC